MAEVDEIASTLENLRARMVDLVVRGLASVAEVNFDELREQTAWGTWAAVSDRKSVV